MQPFTYREDSIEKLKSTEFDIIIVGGGITGAGIARDAALRGYSVGLVEKDDFGYGTSSGSSKLVHAGLRYIGQKEFRLVREASVERKKILEMAPHITKPLKFLVPLHSDTILTKNKLRLAVWLYDLFASFRNHTFHKILSNEKALELLPKRIRQTNFQGAAMYGDGQMDDARLTLEIVLSAEEAGAVVLNYCSADEFQIENENCSKFQLHDKVTGQEFTVQAKTVILACGHWNDKLVKEIDASSLLNIRPTKGIHIITKRFYDRDYAVVVPVDDGRIIFLEPFGDYLLIGTTDTDYSEDYDYIQVADTDIKYLIDAINSLFPDSLSETDIVSAYSGLRPLIFEESKSESDVSRKHKIITVKQNIFAIAGGKYTTYRSMAKEMVDLVDNFFGQKKKCITDSVPLSGWVDTRRKGWDAWARIAKENMIIRYDIPENISHHLLRYGKHYIRLLDEISDDPDLKKVISEQRPYILGEINYFIKHEKAVTLRDVLLRRSQIQLSFEQGLDCINEIANHMGNILEWTPEKIETEIQDYKNSLVWKPK
ncbi:MAG: glycerol-3-phosphate dehydrogenase [Candidatus Hodarchaeales archaeon]